jgi:hypothetical protein
MAMTRSVLQRRGSAAPKKESPGKAGAQVAPLELGFVEGRTELIAAVREAIATGARTIRIEPAEAAAEFISALAVKPRSGLRFVSTAQPDRNRPSSSARIAPETPVDVVVIAASDAAAVSASLMTCIDIRGGRIIAPITEQHSSRRSLFLISIPKAGTYLLFKLAEALGYENDSVFRTEPEPGRSYYVEGSTPHTVAREFFGNFARSEDREHPFLQSPALFIYRDPRDILISEANWYHREQEFPMLHRYLAHLTFEDRLLRLLDDPCCLGSIRDRVAGYAPWLDFPNVIPVSFEELVGSAGGGSDDEQTRLVWSLQLKLHVGGRPELLSKRLFDRSTPTFRQGKIEAWREQFDQNAIECFARLPQDFMERFGYDPRGQLGPMPLHRESYRHRPINTDAFSSERPRLIESYVSLFNIVRFRKRYFGVPQSRGEIDLRNLSEAELDALPNDPDLSRLRAKLERPSVENTLARPEAIPASHSTADERDRRLAELEADLAMRVERLASLEQSMEERGRRLAAVEGTLEERHARLIAVESSVDERDRRLARLEADLALRTERLTSLEQSVEERGQRLGSVERTLEEKHARLMALESTADERDRRLAQLEADSVRTERLGSVERTLEERHARLMELESTGDERDRRLAQLEADSVRIERLASLEQSIAERGQRLESVERTLEERHARLMTLESTADERDRRLAQLEADALRIERLASLEQSIEERSQRLGSVERTLEERHARLMTLESVADERDRRLAQLEADSVRIERLASLEQSMEERSGRLASVEGTLEERHARLVALESTIDERDDRFAKLEADLALRTERLASLEQSMEERDRRLTAVEYALEEKRPVAVERSIKRNGEDGGSELTNASSGLADFQVCRDDEASQSGSVPTVANGRIR